MSAIGFKPFRFIAILVSLFILAIFTLTNTNSVNANDPTPTLPPYYSKIVKTIDNQAQLGGTVGFTVTITLGTAKSGVTVEDIFSGGGKAPDTDFVAGSAKLDGSPIANPTLFANQLNRVHYVFNLGDLTAGTHVLTYQWRISPNLGCYASPANEVHLDVAGVNGHLSTSTIRFPVSCTVCPNVNAELKVSYLSGLHWIVGNPVLQEGSDKVFNLRNNNFAQCFCPTSGTNGIQTLWIGVGGLPFWQVDKYTSGGWILVPNGSAFDLASEPYVAKNSNFSCTQ